MQPQTARVYRSGYEIPDLPARELVPGDVVEVRAGDRVPADVRIAAVLSGTVRAEEAALTGESEPVEKQVEPIFGDEYVITNQTSDKAVNGSSSAALMEEQKVGGKQAETDTGDTIGGRTVISDEADSGLLGTVWTSTAAGGNGSPLTRWDGKAPAQLQNGASLTRNGGGGNRKGGGDAGQSNAAPSRVEIQRKLNMVFAGTTVSSGTLLGIVNSTGMSTEVGRVQAQLEAAAVEAAEGGRGADTPLAAKLAEFSSLLSVGISALCALLWVLNAGEFVAWAPVWGQGEGGGGWGGWLGGVSIDVPAATYYFKVRIAAINARFLLSGMAGLRAFPLGISQC